MSQLSKQKYMASSSQTPGPSRVNMKKKKIKTEEKIVKNEKRKADKTEEMPAKKKIKREAVLDADEDIQLDIPYMLSQQHHLDMDVSVNISHLLEEDHKVSFIARYRKAQTNNIDPELLHEVAASHAYLVNLQTSVGKAYKQLKKEEKVTPELRQALVSVSKKSQLETLMEPHKKGPRTTLAARARDAGLEPAALQLLHGTARCQPAALIQPGQEGRSTLEQIQTGLINIICDVISKDVTIQQEVVRMASHPGIQLVTKQKAASKSQPAPADDQAYKYKNYLSFRKPIRWVRSFEYLAICRAEEQKYITVRLELPDELRYRFRDHCGHRFLSSGMRDAVRESMLERAVGDVFSKSVTRQLERQVRSSLKEAAEREALLVMSRNLKAKLLTPPIRGRVILALDPGFKACKVGVVSAQGEILQTAVLQPRLAARWPHVSSDAAAVQLREMVQRHSVTLLGVGNGTACRETWQYVAELNGAGWLADSPLDVTLVDEGGASEYSTTKAAADEMPELDCSVRSAVSLARRLQDPISEYVKVDVTCLGVGMYQKDMPAGQVSLVLGDVLSDCVGAVGVDLNTASVQLLRKVPGLNAGSAENIAQKRREGKLFVNRQQLRSVKGVGPKSFEQCAGFVRILPVTGAAGKKTKMTPKKGGKVAPTDPEPLDQTIIHPESYPVASKLLKLIGCSSADVGQEWLADRLTSRCGGRSREQLATDLGTDVHTLELIIKALSEPGYDERQEMATPMFWKAAMRAQDVRCGARLRGVVRNPTEFGAFVDLGIGESGLIHVSKMGSAELRVNDHVEVEVIKVENKKFKVDIGLRLLRKLDGRAEPKAG
ncbi:S1 RNA-binding domain-containing protein 1-like [Pollicipes pollicipes]|uniref:S1 RNA-binding domain-containing protein 1-like n=1 Tax=Pollicipes pollicipes TaxID=41117 RepID=UPI00188579AB|nr:S1 RNA-binding domain-containing protein 1-like [Pollicipes pollicipes]XP_037073695.1 S1 RNA-binding domain-containing protein 1-like [Pollicipes pollicipes]XP_037073696.1 S1 RNA-binding domain-containing protein 1-like [Pollicipes pollicipes]XP_037073697.1 S1 RNA-binding domain-containing protein 1-like [Pollicipes pollicipes]XP_037073700.1 S1 RNA-binding domain-containing protein 1-like [Pollicipes pollicipes]XP_037073701.1 S1 RNA-binding domain-containing protein 1-like [Pollicipes polli